MKKIVRKGSYSKTNAENDQQELRRIKDSMKQLEAREKEIKERLGSWMEKSLSPDQSGHYLLTVLNEKGERIHLQRQARKKITLNQERAIEWLEENGHEDAVVEMDVIAEEVTQDQIIDALQANGYDDFIDQKTIVDETYLAQLVEKGQISYTDFEALCDINITYAMTYIDDKKLQESKESGEYAVEENRESVQDQSKRRSTGSRAISNRKAGNRT